MTQWYVKDLSKLTQISVQTLHHYDRIGLLKPSGRLANGYRVYSETDLLKLQQIIALKFFGFELSQIKKLLAADIDVIEHFSAQLQFLEDKAKSLLDASEALKAVLSDCQSQQSIPWETIIKMIEVYRMTRQLENSWEGKVLNANELKEYANFERELQTRFSDSEKAQCEKEWHAIGRDVEENLTTDPTSRSGISLGKRCMDWVNNLYEKKYTGLRNAIWEKGFKSGKAGEEQGLSKAGAAWLDKAIDAYYRERIYQVLSQLDTHTTAKWEALLEDMYGDDQASRAELIKAALADDKISPAAKNWLKK